MTIISLIAAIDLNRLIGKGGNELPWRLPADLKRFRNVTIGKPVIMGRKTFESIGRPLSERTNIVITRNEKYEAPGCVIAHSPEEALRAADGALEVMIIGGGDIFAKFMPRAMRMYLTQIDAEFEGNIYFPEWNPTKWREISRESHEPDKRNPYKYTFLTLERI